MKFTLLAMLPAIAMTLLSAYMNRVHSSDIRNEALNLGMFLTWSFSSLLVLVYRAVRVVRFASKRHQS